MPYIILIISIFSLHPLFANENLAPDSNQQETTEASSDDEHRAAHSVKPQSATDKKKNWIHTQNYLAQRHNLDSLDHEWKAKKPRKGIKSLVKKLHNKNMDIAAGTAHHVMGGDFVSDAVRNNLKTKANPNDMIGANRKAYREKMVDKELTPESAEEMAKMRQRADVTPEQYYAAQKYKTANLTPQERQAGRKWMEDIGEKTGQFAAAGPALAASQGVRAGLSVVPGAAAGAGLINFGINKTLGAAGSIIGGHIGKKGFDHAVNQHNAGYKSRKEGKQFAREKALTQYGKVKDKVFGTKKTSTNKPTITKKIGKIADKAASSTIGGLAGVHGATKGFIVNQVVQGQKRDALATKMKHEKNAEKSGDTSVDFLNAKGEIDAQATTIHKMGKQAKSDRRKIRKNIHQTAKNERKAKQKADEERLKARQAEEAAKNPQASKPKKGLRNLLSRSKKTQPVV